MKIQIDFFHLIKLSWIIQFVRFSELIGKVGFFHLKFVSKWFMIEEGMWIFNLITDFIK